DYPEWHISREVDGSGRHSDWVAQHAIEHDRVHHAPAIPALRTQLEKAARRHTTRRDDQK
ncbi:hypothetical protein AB0B89_33680, partial [Sphaerisporangium sp. NPDC049002]|uniref:hypothetical protein n=1 Tax=Sphaerisporangium sp. NPDC049002 TaxID=3155392 RepID=UPI0033E30041